MIYRDFVTSDVPNVRQFTDAVIRRVVKVAAAGDDCRLSIDGSGGAQTTTDPGWLAAEDAAQGDSGYRAFSHWVPEVPDSLVRGGTAQSLIVTGYDLALRQGVQLTVAMAANHKNPFVRTPVTGMANASAVAVPDFVLPRYKAWDLQRFANWALYELTRKAAGAREVAHIRARPATRLMPAVQEQRYRERDEFAGFAFIDAALSNRHAASRTGRTWRKREISLIWRPGEAGAREQLQVIAADRAEGSGAAAVQVSGELCAFAALWWTEGGVVQARFADCAAGQALGGSWQIRPKGGMRASLLRTIDITEPHDVVNVSPIAPVSYHI
jgi:hypothetical protein